jgi:hypothetical protein
MQHTHDFSVGGIVQMTSAPHLVKAGPYTITRLMPEGRDGEPQYRIRSEDGKVERVVTQADIVAAPARPKDSFSA